jgi:integrase
VARKRDATAGGLTFEQAWQLHQATMTKKKRSQATFDDYQSKIDAHLTDWLDRPLVEITPEACNKRHEKIGENNGTYMANGCMRVVRAIWRRARRQHPGLSESPTANIDFYDEKGRTVVILDWPAWWAGVQQIVNPVRRDFYIWLAFSGCRAGETMKMELANVDLENGVVKYPITKTEAFEMPLSGFMIELLRKRIAQNAKEFGHLGERSPRGGKIDGDRAEAVQATLVAAHVAPFMDHQRRSEGQDFRRASAGADQP